MSITYEDTGDVPQWSIAYRLLMAREHAGLTQAELAERTGISRRTISTYEDRDYEGRRTPRTLRDLAAGCGVRLSWILTGATDPEPGGTELIDLSERRNRVAEQGIARSRWTEQKAA